MEKVHLEQGQTYRDRAGHVIVIESVLPREGQPEKFDGIRTSNIQLGTLLRSQVEAMAREDGWELIPPEEVAAELETPPQPAGPPQPSPMEKVQANEQTETARVKVVAEQKTEAERMLIADVEHLVADKGISLPTAQDATIGCLIVGGGLEGEELTIRLEAVYRGKGQTPADLLGQLAHKIAKANPAGKFKIAIGRTMEFPSGSGKVKVPMIVSYQITTGKVTYLGMKKEH